MLHTVRRGSTSAERPYHDSLECSSPHWWNCVSYVRREPRGHEQGLRARTWRDRSLADESRERSRAVER